MALDSIDKVIAALSDTSTNQNINLSFGGSTTVAGYVYPYNLTASNTLNSPGYVTPTSCAYSSGGLAPTCNTLGFPFIRDVAGKSNYLSRVAFQGTYAIGLQLLDLHWIASGFAANITTAQNMPSFPTLTRNTSGLGNLLFLHVFTQAGSTAVTVTVSFTDSDGTSGKLATCNLPASTHANRTMQMQLPAGCKGVKSVQSVTFSATTGSAGNIGVYIAKPLTTFLNLPTAYQTFNFNFVDVGLPLLESGAAILINGLATTTLNGPLNGHLQVINV